MFIMPTLKDFLSKDLDRKFLLHLSLLIRFVHQYNSDTLKLVKIPLIDGILLNIL